MGRGYVGAPDLVHALACRGVQVTALALPLLFALAGDARFTLASTRTGARYTYRVRASEDGAVFFVSTLTGADNEHDYTFTGTIFDRSRYVHSRRSRIGADAPSVTAFTWGWARGLAHPLLEVYHEGRCGRCARTLTVPESVATGFGPECRGKVAL